MSQLACSRKSLKLTWNILNFSDCFEILVKGIGMESSRFEIEFMGHISWCLLFYPRGYEKRFHTACFLKRCGGYSNREAVVDLKICLKTKNGEENFIKIASNLCFKNEGSLGFPKFVTFKELKRCPLPNDIFTLQCYISPSKDTKYVEDFIPLSNDIKLLHDERTFFDVIVRAGKHEFKVHKHLLIARFPSLVNKIECSHYEESIPFVTISGFSLEIVREVLYFVYTGKLTSLSENSYYRGKLKEFALKYDMVNLLSKLKWDVDECIMSSNLKLTTTDHLLDIKRFFNFGITVNVSIPMSRYGDKLNLRYFASVGEQGNTINVELSTEASFESTYSLFARFTGTLVRNEKVTMRRYQHLISMNNFDSENKEKLENVPVQCFSILSENDICMKNGVNANSRYVMLCEWNLSFGSSSTTTLLPTISNTLTSFSDDMYELFKHGIGTDLVLVTVSDGIEFNVHKSVVCARVPSLMAMFKGDTLAVNGYVHDDLKNVKVEIPDVDSNTFRTILKYIYTGKIKESAMNLLLDLHPKLVSIYMKQLEKENR